MVRVATKHSITLLGSTGSIGCNALDVIARHPDDYTVYALTAKDNVALLAQQCRQFQPQYAAIANPANMPELEKALADSDTKLLAGEEVLSQLASAPEADTVLAAIVGIAGLAPTLAAVQAGKRILLANKEVLVVGGNFFMHEVKKNNALLLPVDSEHNAILQCLQCSGYGSERSIHDVEKVILTASGGPFLNTAPECLAQVTPAQACEHPNWDMGAKISVDSATMMNKGLEVIEARWLFGIDLNYDVLIHPQSIVHALIRFRDGSVIAQMANPDMRVPIAYALAYPDHITSGAEMLNLATCPDLQFRQVSDEQFPCVRLAREAFAQGESAVVALNAANEVAVAAFLAEKLHFNRIPEVIETVLEQVPDCVINGINTIMQVDEEARAIARAHIGLAPEPRVV